MNEYKFFRRLSEQEEKEFREWAHRNYVVGDEIPSTWHPVIVDECQAMIAGLVKKEPRDGMDREEQS
jgi:hypothetical protein